MADFNKDDFSEAVRNIVKDYGNQYKKTSEKLIDNILSKIEKGESVYKAVTDALSDTAFFNANKEAIVDAMYLAACAGYGILPSIVAKTSESNIKNKLLSDSWTSDKMQLSKRLHGTSKAMRESIIDTINASMLGAESVKQMAMKLYDGYNSGQKVINQAELPKYLKRLEMTANLAVQGDSLALLEINAAVQKIQVNIDNLKSKEIKAAYQSLVDATSNFKPKAIEKAIHTAVEEKARYHAMRIARTESARAWFDGFIAENQDNEDVFGYRWVLSSRHNFVPFDQCDVCANMDVGYGKGIYPKGQVPFIPRHPHCMCMLEVVYVWEIDKHAKLNPNNARNYIDNLDEGQQSMLFGREGLQAYQNGADWQTILRGWNGFNEPTSRLSKSDFETKNNIQVVGTLNKDIYKVVTEDIQSNDVIITDNQIQHIKERHPNDYERFSKYFTEIINDPDYILEANKPNTAFVLKSFNVADENFQLILRLVTSGDPREYSNSIITFLKVSDKKWNKYLRNKKILYSKE